MHSTVAAVLEGHWATIAGVFAMICLTLSPLFQKRTSILVAQLGTSIGYSTHYALTDTATAAVSCGLSGIQVLLAIPLANRPALKPLFHLFHPVLLIAAVLTWHGMESLLSASALGLTTLARLQDRTGPLRALMLGAQSLWLAHDVMVQSVPAIAGDVAALATGIAMLARPCWQRLRMAGQDLRGVPAPGQQPTGLLKH